MTSPKGANHSGHNRGIDTGIPAGHKRSQLLMKLRTAVTVGLMSDLHHCWMLIQYQPDWKRNPE